MCCELEPMKTQGMTHYLKVATVEDSPLVAERLQSMVQELSHIEYAGNAANIEDAMLLIKEHGPDVVILDIHLKDNAPLTTGIDLLKLLRINHPNIITIILSNLSAPQYRNRCLALGANYFFDKSNDFDRVPEVLTTLIPSTS